MGVRGRRVEIVARLSYKLRQQLKNKKITKSHKVQLAKIHTTEKEKHSSRSSTRAWQEEPLAGCSYRLPSLPPYAHLMPRPPVSLVPTQDRSPNPWTIRSLMPPSQRAAISAFSAVSFCDHPARALPTRKACPTSLGKSPFLSHEEATPG